MSRIEKLQIQGIRSFDSGSPQAIVFYSPLTLVVGVNGSGKTTIIECLKYAVTGMMPPNTKVGGAFIHDPKITGENKAWAQVGLKFTSTTGVPLTIKRSMDVTVKKTSRSLRTLDCNLKISRAGDSRNISTRVAELDLILPEYLGVSTAVLDNVIFCHQEESLWPLSESSALKRKFDEIFEAQKYTKAIKNIADIRKQQNIELREYKIHEQHAKHDKDRAIKAQKRSLQLQDEIEELRKQAEDTDRRMTRAKQLSMKAHEESENFAKVLGALEGKRIEANSTRSAIENLKKHLKEVPESDEWLENTLAEFDSKQEQLGSEIRAKQTEYLSHNDQVQGLRQQLNVKFDDRGRYRLEKDDHERKLMRRTTTIRDAAVKHNLRGYDDLGDDKMVEEFVYRIKKLSKEQQATLDRVKREHESQKRDAQSQINQLTERKKALQENRISAKRQMALNDREAAEYQKKADSVKVDEGSQAVIESRVEDLKNRISDARAASESANSDKKLREANSQLREHEDNYVRLNNELSQSTKRVGETARLAHVKQELKEREKSLRTLLDAHSERIKSVIGGDWDAASLSQKHQDVLSNAGHELSSAERDRDAATRELEQIQFKHKSARDELAKKQQTASDIEKRILDVTESGPSDFEENLLTAQTRAEDARQNSQGSEQLRRYLENILKTLNGKNACRVCSRAFNKEKDTKTIGDMRQRLENNIQQVMADVIQSNVEACEEALNEMLDLKGPYDNWKFTTETEIPALQKIVDTLNKEREMAVAKAEKRDKIVEERQIAKKEVESVSATVSSTSKCYSEVTELKSQVDNLTAKESQQTGCRTLDDIQEEISNTNESIRQANTVISRLTMERDQAKTELSNMELQLRDLGGELQTAGYQLRTKSSHLARVEEYKGLNQKQREIVDKADSEIERLDPQVSAAKTKYDDLARRAEANEQDLSNETSRLRTSVQSITELNEEIQAYVSRGGHSQLTDIGCEIKNIEQNIGHLTTEQERVTREINKLSGHVKDGESTRRQYADNLQYRQQSRALEDLAREIEELESHNADVDRERLRLESERHNHEWTTLNARQAGYVEAMKARDTQLAEILADYQTDFMDAPKRYREAHIKVETTKAAVEDLARYGGALDKAIMKYHSLKMDEINNIIDELWQATYRGSDVDTILIKAENDSGGRSNRSYNYRVVMIKQGTEMDMRGRCSAGQKVLASIIIRLALAECFSSRCGVFALDEPTTNLDEQNIEALARALHSIIKNRRAQANFQLIVITHDENFLKHMHCEEFADYYYRVSRDAVANSVIERQSIAEVMN